MARRFPLNYLNQIAGQEVGGLEMYKYGLPYRNAGGIIYPRDTDLVDMMLVAVERFPELHIVTSIKGVGQVNRYEEGKHAWCYQLFRDGCKDPDIEFSETWDDTLPPMNDLSREPRRVGCQVKPDLRLKKMQEMAQSYALNYVMNYKR